MQEVAHQFGVEELHRQLHQLYEEVRYERDVDSCGDMQKYFGADKVDGGTAEKEHHFSQQHQPHEADVLSPYTRIYDGLREKRENELQQRAEQQTENELREEAFVFPYVVPKEF